MNVSKISLTNESLRNFLIQMKVAPLDHIERLSHEYGPTFCIEGFDEDSFFTSDVELITFLLAKTHTSTVRPVEAMAGLVQVENVRILGNGIITDQSPSWKGQRKELLKALNAIPKDQLDAILEQEFHKQIVDVLELRQGNPHFQKTVRNFLTAVLLRLTFDYYDPALLRESASFFANLDETQSKLALLPKSTFRPDILAKILAAEIDVDKIKNDSFRRENRGNPPLQSYVGYARDEPLSVEHHDKLKNLWTSGGSTTAILLNSCLTSLQEVPGAYEILASPDSETFLKLCYFETLRLHPSIPILFRELTEDHTHRGHLFKKGSKFRALLYLVQRNPGFWAEPLKYDPYRFQNFDFEKGREYFMPFGLGLRSCVGTNLAENVFMGFFTRFFEHYRVLRIENKGTKLGLGITGLFRDEISITVERR